MRILDEILNVNSNPMLILTGGEPLLRDDLEAIAEYLVSLPPIKSLSISENVESEEDW